MLERMKKILLTVIPDADLSGVTMETNLQSDLGLNSLSTMLLALAIEDEFGLRFENAVDFKTVGDVCAYIESKA